MAYATATELIERIAEQTVIDLIDTCSPDNQTLFDLCYAENLLNPARPLWLTLRPGSGPAFCAQIVELLRHLNLHLDAEAIVNKILDDQGQDPKIALACASWERFIKFDYTLTVPCHFVNIDKFKIM